MTDTPEPRFERFRVVYPSGAVIPSFYAGGATAHRGPGGAPLGNGRARRGFLGRCDLTRVKGIHAAFQGRLGQDVELRIWGAGRDWARLSVAVGEGGEVTWVSVAVFDEKARALAGLTKGAEVYVEGRLSLKGAQRTGLSVSAWRVEALGQRKQVQSQSARH